MIKEASKSHTLIRASIYIYIHLHISMNTLKIHTYIHIYTPIPTTLNTALHTLKIHTCTPIHMYPYTYTGIAAATTWVIKDALGMWLF